jgi:hypothetical protein
VTLDSTISCSRRVGTKVDKRVNDRGSAIIMLQYTPFSNFSSDGRLVSVLVMISTER